MLLAHETGEGSLSDALVGQMYLIKSSMPPPYQESATLAGAITYKQTEPSGRLAGFRAANRAAGPEQAVQERLQESGLR